MFIFQISHKIQHLVNTIRNSSTLSQQFESLQSTPLGLIPNCVTRWSATFYMLERFVKLLVPVGLLLLEIDKDGRMFSLDPQSCERIKCYLPLLEPLEKFCRHIEGDTYVTISTVAPKLSDLQNFYQSNEIDSSLSANLKDSFRDYLEKRFGWIFISPTLPLLASALDPRYGHLRFVELNFRNSVWEKLAEEGELIVGEKEDSRNFPSIDLEDIIFALRKLRNHFETKVHEVEPLEFWKHYSHGHLLLPLAQMILAIPASSASVERGFSSTGFIMEGRPLINLQHVQQMAVVRHYVNRPEYNFDDLCTELAEKQ
jgi:hypothetical protein